jgi:hypothetical protein
MIRMPSLPVRQDDHPRTRLANHARHFEPILPSILDAAVWKIQRTSPTDAKDLGCVVCFPSAIICGTARAHLSLSQIENARSLPAPCGFQQSTAAGLFDVVTMRGDGKNVEGRRW